MTKADLNTITENYPKITDFEDIKEFDRLDERISAVGAIFANTIGVCDGFIEFCPDNEPPLSEEVISWLWVTDPDLRNKIDLDSLSADLLLLVNSYASDQMEQFWEEMS